MLLGEGAGAAPRARLCRFVTGGTHQLSSRLPNLEKKMRGTVLPISALLGWK